MIWSSGSKLKHLCIIAVLTIGSITNAQRPELYYAIAHPLGPYASLSELVEGTGPTQWNPKPGVQFSAETAVHDRVIPGSVWGPTTNISFTIEDGKRVRREELGPGIYSPAHTVQVEVTTYTLYRDELTSRMWTKSRRISD